MTLVCCRTPSVAFGSSPREAGRPLGPEGDGRDATAVSLAAGVGPELKGSSSAHGWTLAGASRPSLPNPGLSGACWVVLHRRAVFPPKVIHQRGGRSGCVRVSHTATRRTPSLR